jgi:tRNA dimethylallyltransferase
MPVTTGRPGAPRLPALVLCGPTASGKSEFALRLAERLPIELISVDSTQVYRGLDIGSAKPSLAARARVPHHLIDIRDPREAYNAGEFVADAVQLIDAIHARGRVPLLVGGTMLYLRSLLHGMAAMPTAQPELRLAIDARAARDGWPALHAELAQADPESAARIHPNDAQRIQRALEVYHSTGQPISAWQRATRPPTDVPFLRWVLWPADRAALKQRIGERFEAMLVHGWVNEVEVLAARPDLTGNESALRSVGYRQFWDYVKGRCDFETAKREALQATLQLVRRQLTWARSDVAWQRVEPFAPQAFERWAESVTTALDASAMRPSSRA